ncbi:class I SAM-dependent methyltransferase [Nocardia salmonicida]|uniref:class I SAM-dependent methyltransferase n=1 Tax=Nocardia salmonicida TaxID=53431 RepID=UPI002E2DC2DF|nr:class I SAM-dependent methyltransferase [Nocardia salmonicida]
MKNSDVESAIATMPRGGPDASWLDRRMQTNALEYIDRDDIPDEVKQKVIAALDRFGTLGRIHEKNARTALRVVADIPEPRILEIGAGHGKLSAKIVEYHSAATVTVSDLDPSSVAKIAAGELGAHPRVRTQLVDATAIDAPDDSYDLVVFAMSFHHLPPSIAYKAIAEATRVGKRFLVIDLERQSMAGHALGSILGFPFLAAGLLAPPLRPFVHDAVISGLRAYSHSAFSALGRAAHPQMGIEFLPAPTRFGPPSTTVLFSRPEGLPNTRSAL